MKTIAEMSRKKSRANAAMVARRLGISQVTVSRAFSGKLPVAENTKRRIMQMAGRIGYRPNPLAAGLRGSATRSIGIIWPLYSPWWVETGAMLYERLRARGYAVYQGNIGHGARGMRQEFSSWAGRSLDGLILWDEWGVAKQLAQKRDFEAFRAVVTIASDDIPNFHGDLLIQDRYRALEEIAEHLAASGRRRPAIVLAASPRMQGKANAFLNRCRLRGMETGEWSVIDIPIVDYQKEPETTREVFARRFKRSMDVDALVCGSDEQAMAAIGFLADRGISVPETVAVVGANNSVGGPLYRPALASIDRRPQKMAVEIERMLFRRLESPQLPPQRGTVYMRFKWRESAGGRCGIVGLSDKRAFGRGP